MRPILSRIIFASAALLLPVIGVPAADFVTLHNFNFVDGDSPESPLIAFDNTLYGTAVGGGSAGNGTVFKVNTDGTGFATLYNFGNSDGFFPVAGLARNGDALFGIAAGGGDPGSGTIYTINIDGTGFTNIYDFSVVDNQGLNHDGANPDASLVLAGDTLYGTTSEGGSAGTGTIFKINTDGSGFTSLYSFTAVDINRENNDGAFPTTRLVVSGRTLYGTASQGGTGGSGTLFSINTDGTGFVTLHSFSATENNGFNRDGKNPDAPLALAGGTLYGTTFNGGSERSGTLFRIDIDGGDFTILHAFSATDDHGFNNDGANPAGALVFSDDMLYGTTVQGGKGGAGTIFAINAVSGRFVTVYSFGATRNGANADGYSPFTGLVASGDSLYGAAGGGGIFRGGTVFALRDVHSLFHRVRHSGHWKHDGFWEE